MAETIDIPAVGPLPKKYVYIGGAAIAGVVGYAWWRYRTTGDAPGEQAELVDDGAGLVDPDGSGNTPGATGNASGNFQVADPSVIDTNSEWVQSLIDPLEAAGWEPQFIMTTLGKYLARDALTANEKLLVIAALAFGGKPPEGGPYTIIDAPPSTPSTGTPDKPTTAPTLSIAAAHSTYATLTWTTIPGIEGYQLYSNLGKLLASVNGTRIDYGNLTPSRQYGFKVRGLGKSGAGPFSNTVIVHTPKQG